MDEKLWGGSDDEDDEKTVRSCCLCVLVSDSLCVLCGQDQTEEKFERDAPVHGEDLVRFHCVCWLLLFTIFWSSRLCEQETELMAKEGGDEEEHKDEKKEKDKDKDKDKGKNKDKEEKEKEAEQELEMPSKRPQKWTPKKTRYSLFLCLSLSLSWLYGLCLSTHSR